MISKILSFLKSAYSETNGDGSSSRLLSTILALNVVGMMWVVIMHIVHLSDSGILGLWLSNLPLIVSALVFLFTAPYGVNKGSASVTDILNILRGKKNE